MSSGEKLEPLYPFFFAALPQRYSGEKMAAINLPSEERSHQPRRKIKPRQVCGNYKLE
jgi:hypothetical protein